MMFIEITSLFREVKLIANNLNNHNITQQNTTKVLYVDLLQCYLLHIILKEKKGCIPTPKTLKLYDYKCFYLINDDFGGKFQNPFSPKLFTEIFGDLIKNPPNICSPKIFAERFFKLYFLTTVYNLFFLLAITHSHLYEIFVTWLMCLLFILCVVSLTGI